MAGRLADHHGLDQIADNRHQRLLGVLVAIVAGEEQQLADGNLDIGQIELGLQPGDLFLIILRRHFGVGELQDQLLA